jgi:hypothetical protein
MLMQSSSFQRAAGRQKVRSFDTTVTLVASSATFSTLRPTIHITLRPIFTQETCANTAFPITLTRTTARNARSPRTIAIPTTLITVTVTIWVWAKSEAD